MLLCFLARMTCTRSIETSRFLLASLALITYLWFCLSWFDHELDWALAKVPSAFPGLLCVAALAAFVWKSRKLGQAAPGLSTNDKKIITGLSLFAAATRLPFLWGAYGLFSSDAAAQGVMALHIIEGRHHPVFLYNWSYVGSFKAHLTALIDLALNEPVLSFTAAAIVVQVGFVVTLYLLGRVVLPLAGATIAALYAILSPGFLTAWGMHNEGSYLDVAFFGTALLAIGARLLRDGERPLWRSFWMGVCGGFAFWVHILATYYLLTAMALVVSLDWTRKSISRLAVFAVGFVVGDFPGLLWNASNEWLSFRWWSLDAGEAESADRFARAVVQLKEAALTSFAVLAGWWPRDEPPWPATFWRWALMLVIPAAFAWFAWLSKDRLKLLAKGQVTAETMLLGFALLVVGLFALSSFGWLTDEPRYLLFLFSVLPIFLASVVTSLWRGWRPAGLLLSIALLYVNLYGSSVYWSRAIASDVVNREFVAGVEKLGVRYGYTDYHLSYKYVFLSHGRLVLTSELGPSQTEWYFPFREEVARAEQAALIPRSFRFARRLSRRLNARGIAFERADLLYPVLYGFSEPVTPEQLR